MRRTKTRNERARTYGLLRDKFNPGDQIVIALFQYLGIKYNTYPRYKYYSYKVIITNAIVVACGKNEKLADHSIRYKMLMYDDITVDVSSNILTVKSQDCYKSKDEIMNVISHYRTKRNCKIEIYDYTNED